MNKIVFFYCLFVGSFAMNNDTAATISIIETQIVEPAAKAADKKPQAEKSPELDVIKAELVRENKKHYRSGQCKISWESL